MERRPVCEHAGDIFDPIDTQLVVGGCSVVHNVSRHDASHDIDPGKPSPERLDVEHGAHLVGDQEYLLRGRHAQLHDSGDLEGEVAVGYRVFESVLQDLLALAWLKCVALRLVALSGFPLELFEDWIVDLNLIASGTG